MPRKTRAARVDQVQQLLTEDMTPTAIARDLGLSVRYVVSLIKDPDGEYERRRRRSPRREGPWRPTDNPGIKYTDQERALVRRLAREGYSVSQIAQRTGISRSYVGHLRLGLDNVMVVSRCPNCNEDFVQQVEDCPRRKYCTAECRYDAQLVHPCGSSQSFDEKAYAHRLAVLDALRDHPGATSREIADALDDDTPQGRKRVSRDMAVLQRKGVVVSCGAEPGRGWSRANLHPAYRWRLASQSDKVAA